MRSVVTRISQGLAWLVLAGLVAEFYLAGAALFGVLTFQPHRMLGISLAVATVLLLILTIVARPSPRMVRLVAVLATLTVVQVVLPSLRADLPWAAALHAVVAVGIATQLGAIVRGPGTAAADSRSPTPLAPVRPST
jgi:hypothetical protein